MTLTPEAGSNISREVLLAHGDPADAPTWLGDVEDELRPSGLVLFRTHTRKETISRVEEGGLAAAILIEDERRIEPLSLLRVIRSIDVELPCWLVTHDATRQLLEAAWALNVMSVITQPVEAAELTLSLRRALANVIRGN